MTGIRFTSKQIELLVAIKKLSKESYCTVQSILEVIPYEASRSAVRHSIKILIDEGFVETCGTVAGSQTFAITAKAESAIG